MDAEVNVVLLLRKREAEDLQKGKVGYNTVVLPANIHRKSAVAIIIVAAFILCKNNSCDERVG